MINEENIIFSWLLLNNPEVEPCRCFVYLHFDTQNAFKDRDTNDCFVYIFFFKLKLRTFCSRVASHFACRSVDIEFICCVKN